MSDELKFFKLNYSGKIEELNPENVYESFNIYDIITIYNPAKKTVYIWIGKRAAQSLKRHIANIRHTISKELPELKILRNITIESGSEPEDFFKLTNLDRSKLIRTLKNQDLRLLPVISEINRLKERADKFFIEENFKNAVQVSQMIQDLAKEIEDESLYKDQESFIEEARIKNRAKEIFNQIKEEATKLKLRIDKLREREEIIKIDNLIRDFLIKYKEYNISEVQGVQDLISISQEINDRSDSEKKRLIEKLRILDFDFKENLENQNILKAQLKISKAEEFLAKLENMKLNLKWKKNIEELDYLKNKSKKNITKKTNEMTVYLEERKIRESVNSLDEIIIKLKKMNEK